MLYLWMWTSEQVLVSTTAENKNGQVVRFGDMQYFYLIFRATSMVSGQKRHCFVVVLSD